ncbi:MAG: anoctamin [archaeon]|nr:anoctamin [archaeon]
MSMELGAQNQIPENEPEKLKLRSGNVEGYECNPENAQNPINAAENPKTNEEENKQIDADAVMDKLEAPGVISKAKIHGDSRRVLHLANDIDDPSSINFCDDCYLPQGDEKNVIKYDFYDSEPKDFANFGMGIYLFFFFIKYIIATSIALFISASLPYIILSSTYFTAIRNFCTEYYMPSDMYTTDTDLIYIPLCEIYVDEGEYLHNKYKTADGKEKEFEVATADFSYMLSGEPMKDYLDMMEDMTAVTDNEKMYSTNYVLNFNFISFISSFAIFFMNMFFISLSQTMLNEIDYKVDSPSDFSVLISDVPADRMPMTNNEGDGKTEQQRQDEFEQKFAEWIKEYVGVPGANIIEINPIYKQTGNSEARAELRELKRGYRVAKANNEDTYGGFLCFCKKSTDGLENKIKEKEDFLNDIVKPSLNKFTGTVIATFELEKEKETYLSYFPNSFLERIFSNMCSKVCLTCCDCLLSDDSRRKYSQRSKISAMEAPEPEDIVWENLEYRFMSKFWRSCLAYFICILLIGISFVCVIFLNKVQSDSEKDGEDNYILKYGLSLAITAVSSGINVAVSKVFVFFSDFEKHWTHTDYFLSLSIKLTIFTFINSAIIPFISNGINISWTDYTVLISNLLTSFLCANLVSPLLSASCYDWMLNKIFKWFFVTRKYGDKPDEEIPEFTQKELNAYFELPEMGIADQYSTLMKNVLMAMFFLPIFPLGVPILFLGAILTYFVEKFKVINVYKSPDMLDQSICFFYLDFFVYAIFVMAIGNYVFVGDTHGTTFFQMFIIIFYPVIGLFPYPNLIRSKDFSGALDAGEETKYSDAFFTFNFDYQRLNPATQTKGILNYLQRLKDSGIITEDDYNSLKDLIGSINIVEIFYSYNATQKIMRQRQERRMAMMMANGQDMGDQQFTGGYGTAGLGSMFGNKDFLNQLKSKGDAMKKDRKSRKSRKNKQFNSETVQDVGTYNGGAAGMTTKDIFSTFNFGSRNPAFGRPQQNAEGQQIFINPVVINNAADQQRNYKFGGAVHVAGGQSNYTNEGTAGNMYPPHGMYPQQGFGGGYPHGFGGGYPHGQSGY